MKLTCVQLGGEIAKRIRIQRVKLGLSQPQLARKMGYGHHSYLSQLECNTRTPNAYTLYLLAQALDCKIADFLPEE